MQFVLNKKVEIFALQYATYFQNNSWCDHFNARCGYNHKVLPDIAYVIIFCFYIISFKVSKYGKEITHDFFSYLGRVKFFR